MSTTKLEKFLLTLSGFSTRPQQIVENSARPFTLTQDIADRFIFPQAVACLTAQAFACLFAFGVVWLVKLYLSRVSAVVCPRLARRNKNNNNSRAKSVDKQTNVCYSLTILQPV